MAKDKLRIEEEWVKRHLEDLVRLYGNSFIAVHNRRVIDSDENSLALAVRVEGREEREGNILITKPMRYEHWKGNSVIEEYYALFEFLGR